MTAWKAKLYDVMRKVDGLGSAEKEKVLPTIEDLHMLLDEMADRVENLTSGVTQGLRRTTNSGHH